MIMSLLQNRHVGTLSVLKRLRININCVILITFVFTMDISLAYD
jgi:hypothetical protein